MEALAIWDGTTRINLGIQAVLSDPNRTDGSTGKTKLSASSGSV